MECIAVQGGPLEEGLSLLFLLRIYLGAIEVRLEEEKEESFKRRNEANIRDDDDDDDDAIPGRCAPLAARHGQR